MSCFNLDNIHCASCVSKIESKLNKINGIKTAKVSLLDKTLHVEYVNSNLDQQVIDAVKTLGYNIINVPITKTRINLWLNTILPIILGLIVMMVGMSKDLMLNSTGYFGITFDFITSILTLVIFFISAREIFISGWRGFKSLSFNMYSLIILGISSAWLYSTFIIIMSCLGYLITPHVYFESALIIVGLINLGSYLENKATATATDAINSLSKLQPEKTTIIKNNKEQLISTNSLRVNDIIKIRPGERIPADGIILEGNGYVDESMLTGEAIAIHKTIENKVAAGTINTTGSFLFKALAVGTKTMLAEIVELVKTAQMSKPELSKIADKVSLIFVPAIISIAVIAAILWLVLGPEPRIFHMISVFMTVLIIACPCSVGLAIPVALIVGLGKSAAFGVLIRDASCLDAMNKLDYILLDKTGTITEGKPQVINFISSFNDALNIMKTIESNSEHPIAKAILSYKPEIMNNLSCNDFQSEAGMGISGIINEKRYFIGSENYIVGKIKISNAFKAKTSYTQIFLANEYEVLARVDIADKIKSDSAAAIAKIRGNGIKIAMVTGDNEANAMAIAKQVNIDKVYANCSPTEKVNIIHNLRNNKYVVAFVGDGINDAPSLATADVGIAMGGGTDIAMQSANITLLQNSLFGIHKAILVGKAINRNMQQNLLGAFIYNVVAVIIATGLFYPVWHVLLNPIIASITMSLSSITVIMNALRLRNIKVE